jgi:hypothetical protein|mmetsp:Transcript_63821/g.142403  ORF Transcript_63821/g.142403 Transcript_63821/m.142403 type:complete len:96 (+) Transcript_63821:2114-2401(+)
MKCALNCVHGCLAKCSHVYYSGGIDPSRNCYVDCTKNCLPSCISHGTVHASGAELTALTASAEKSVEASALLAHTGSASESMEMLRTSLPRGSFR